MISIIIPAYNEEKRIIPTLKKIREFLDRKIKYEILIIDDGSTDNTVEKIKAAKRGQEINILSNEINKGKGFSVRKGVFEAKGDLVLITDADLSTPIETLELFLQYANYDVIIGSRNLKNSRITIAQPKHRRILGQTFPILIRWLLKLPVKDTQCGFKMLKTNVAKELFSKQLIDGFAYDVEIIYIAYRNEYKIKELPVEWSNSEDSKVKIIKDPILMLFDLFLIKYYSILGRYTKKIK